MNDLAWHKKQDNLQLLQTYHDKYARQPDMKEAKNIHTIVMKLIETKLKEKKCCVDIVYAGSAYDGLKIGRINGQNDNIEFDVMVVIAKDIAIANFIKGLPETRAMLASTDSTNEFIKGCFIKDDYISPNRVVDKFFGYLVQIHDTTIKDALKLHNCTSKIRRHGPAIQLDVIRNENLFYSLDIVPTLTILKNLKLEYYVAKSENGIGENSWRRSFSVQEKNQFTDIDSQNGCCKKLIRILKAIFAREASLTILTSYHIKTIMMHLIDKNKDKAQWMDANIFNRFLDFMKLLSEMLSVKIIPHYYVKSANLIQDMQQITINNIKSRIDNIVAKEAAFTKIVNG